MKDTMVLLLIDRNVFWQEQLQIVLANYPIEIIGARTAAEARRILLSQPDVDIIVTDDCISGAELDALELVAEIQRDFQGHIFACCANCNNGRKMIEAGCDEHMYKSQLASRIIELLRHCGVEFVV